MRTTFRQTFNHFNHQTIHQVNQHKQKNITKFHFKTQRFKTMYHHIICNRAITHWLNKIPINLPPETENKTDHTIHSFTLPNTQANNTEPTSMCNKTPGAQQHCTVIAISNYHTDVQRRPQPATRPTVQRILDGHKVCMDATS